MALALPKRLGGLSMAAEKSQEKKLPDTGLLLVGMGMGHVNGMTVEALDAAAAAEVTAFAATVSLVKLREAQKRTLM